MPLNIISYRVVEMLGKLFKEPPVNEELQVSRSNAIKRDQQKSTLESRRRSTRTTNQTSNFQQLACLYSKIVESDPTFWDRQKRGMGRNSGDFTLGMPVSGESKNAKPTAGFELLRIACWSSPRSYLFGWTDIQRLVMMMTWAKHGTLWISEASKDSSKGQQAFFHIYANLPPF